MPQNKERQYAIELSSWQKDKTLNQITADLASFSIEAGKTSPEKRINPVAVNLESFGSLVKKGSLDPEDQASEAIYNWAQTTRPSVHLWLNELSEENVLVSMKDFVDVNPGYLCVWISPPLSGRYQESRIAVYQVVEANNQKFLFFRNICGSLSPEECYNLALGLKKYSPNENLIVNDSGLLRSSPLSLSVPGNSFISFLSENISGVPSWEEVKKGKDIDEKVNALKVASGILDESTYAAINRAITLEEQILIGRSIEIRLQERLGKVLSSSSCGTLYSSIFQGHFLFSARGVSSSELSTRRKHCGKCGKYGYFLDGETCPYSSKD